MSRTDATAATAAKARHTARGSGPSQPRRRASLSKALVPVVAIGDVHGCATLLEEVLEQHRGSGSELIFLGDLIDRSPEPGGDRQVLERIWALQRNPKLWGLAKVTVLRGNHEQMLLDALSETIPGKATDLWLWNGGDLDLLAFAAEHRDWFEKLPYTAMRGNYLFVHAGVRPGVPLEEQAKDDLIWIRKPFLSRPHGLPYTVVHGHSITKDHQIERRPERINLDTGAFGSGVLSSLRLDPNMDGQKSRKVKREGKIVTDSIVGKNGWSGGGTKGNDTDQPQRTTCLSRFIPPSPDEQ